MITRGGTQLAAYPTIVDQETSVGLRLADSRTASDEQTRRGLVRLFKIINRKSIKSQVNWLPELDRHSVTISRGMPTQQIKPQLGDLLTRISMVEREKIPRSEEDFRQLQSNAVERIGIATQELANWIPKFATSLHQAQLKLDEVPNRFSTAKGNLRQQLKNLCVENFLTNTTWLWLKHFPRYFEGMSYRIEKLASTDPVKDRASADLIDSFWQRYLEAEEFQLAQAIVDPELDSFRWLIEEFRISLFAQPLGTCVKVSEPRLEKQWAKVRRM
jgi:ATP-dependent helicase HrpA